MLAQGTLVMAQEMLWLVRTYCVRSGSGIAAVARDTRLALGPATTAAGLAAALGDHLVEGFVEIHDGV